MRQAFTLIELMIVIAIIAIIAAIAVPNLLESRVTANEAAAATSLKSGVFPGQVQFQAGGYLDTDNDGVGCYASQTRAMAGSSDATGGTTVGDDLVTSLPRAALALLGPDFNVADSTAGVSATGANINAIGGYGFALATSTTENDAERFWGGFAIPSRHGDTGRRAFGISSSGNVIASKGTLTAANCTMANIILADGTEFAAYETNYQTGSAQPNSSGGHFVPYKK